MVSSPVSTPVSPVVSDTRRALVLGAGAVLAACAGAPEVAAPTAAAAIGALLTPWLSISGGWRANQRVAFVQPVGVAARGDTLLVADAGARILWRVDRTRDAITAFAAFTGGVADHGAALQLGADFSVWVAQPADRTLRQYDLHGKALRTLRDDDNLARPVAVALREDRAEIYVGDAATAQVLVFDSFGRMRRLLAGDRALPLQSLTAMCFGPAGLYVLDRAAQQVVLLGPRGELLQLIGENQLVRPRALAVDSAGRVFVADEADQQIKVLRGPRLLGSFGGAGRLGRIEALALDGNLLFVADSLQARVQVLLVAPTSMERPAP